MDTLVTYMNKTVLCKNRITSIPMHYHSLDTGVMNQNFFTPISSFC